jgi:hypothetical protein
MLGAKLRLATLDAAYPVAVVMALTVRFEATSIGARYWSDEAVGVEPSSV